MSDRVSGESIEYMRKIDSLTWFQEAMYYRLVLMADDLGHYYADPLIVKSALFPAKSDLTLAAVVGGLDRLEKAGLIRRYKIREDIFLQVVDWRHGDVQSVLERGARKI